MKSREVRKPTANSSHYQTRVNGLAKYLDDIGAKNLLEAVEIVKKQRIERESNKWWNK